MTFKTLSLIVPAYKKEKTIVKDIQKILTTLNGLPFVFEIIVVVDGCLKTYEKIKKIKSGNLKIFSYEKNRGKGFAVKYGVSKAKGEVIGFVDAGSEIKPESIGIGLKAMEKVNADIAIGSKLHIDSQVNYPLSRKILSSGYRFIISTLFKLDIKDTQVGLKFFKKEVAKDLFSKLNVYRFAFDIEILTDAVRKNYKIVEFPIDINFIKNSNINPFNFWKISFIMFLDTVIVFYRLRIANKHKKY